VFPVILKLHRLLPLLPLIACFSLIYIIQAHKLDSRARNGFLVFLGGMGFWALGALLIRNSDSAATATFWARLLRAAVTLMSVAALQFVCELLELKRKRLVYLAYGITVFIVVTTFSTNLIVAPAGENIWGYYGGRGPWKTPCTLFSFSVMIYAVILVFRRRYSRDREFYRQAYITIIAFTTTMIGGVLDILPTLGLPVYPAGMITHTFFAVLIAYGAFQYQLIGVLSKPQPRIVLASITYALIASGIALTFADSASKTVFVYLLTLLFLSFNLYHYFDDIAYLVQKHLRIHRRPLLLKSTDSSLLFDNSEIGILALGRRQQVLFINRRAARILGPEMLEANSLSALQNDILRRRLEMNCRHRRETVFSLDGKTWAEVTPIEFGHEYAGTLVCFYSKSGMRSQNRRRTSLYASLDLRRIFRRD